jgi:hypothetical protein
MPEPDHHPSSPAQLQGATAAGASDQLLSARAAALWLDVNPRTAQLRASRALRSGDRLVQTIAGAYCAPRWWRKLALAKPIKPGRPSNGKVSTRRVKSSACRVLCKDASAAV